MATSTYLFFTLIIASSLCSFGVSRVEPQKVTLSVYYETLCPYCATFIETNLARIFAKGLITILNLRLVPWGNASTATFCQHGPDVCKLNSLEACALDVLQDVLEQKYANETTHLSPPLKFVPWLVLNNQPIGNVTGL
nr:gamma-interferon-responsive lysosomal thiol protein-like isoform X3 [Malus domestica]